MLNVNKIWDIQIAVTRKQYRNLGLTTALSACSIEAGLLIDDVSIIRALCVSDISAKLCKYFSMECVVDKHVSEYKDENGEPWIKNVPAEPNDRARIFVLKKNNYGIIV